MSNPYTSPTPEGDGSQQWSTQQPAAGAPQYSTPASPYGQPGWDGSQPQYAAASYVNAEQIRSNSTVVLVLGILGLILIGLFGSIPAWIWGNSLLRQGAEAGLPESYTQNAKIGKILGIVGVVLWGIAIVIGVILVIGLVVAAANSGY